MTAFRTVIDKKVNFIALLFAFGCIYFSVEFSTSEFINYKIPFKWIIQRAPEFKVLFDDIMQNLLPFLSLLLAVLLIEFSLKNIFIKDFRNAEWEVTGNYVKIFDFKVGKEITIPLSNISEIKESKNLITLHLDKKEELKLEIPTAYLLEATTFCQVLKDNWNNSNSITKSYKVIFSSKNPNDKELSLLSKLLKLPSSKVTEKANHGTLTLKSTKELSLAKSIVTKLSNYGLKTEIIEEEVNKSTINEELKNRSSLFCFPYLSMILIVAMMPGGLLIWLYWFFSSLEKANKTIKPTIKISGVLLMCLIEYFATASTSLEVNSSESIIYSVLMLLLSVLLGITLRASFKDSRLSLILSILFPVIYLTYKTNALVKELFK